MQLHVGLNLCRSKARLVRDLVWQLMCRLRAVAGRWASGHVNMLACAALHTSLGGDVWPSAGRATAYGMAAVMQYGVGWRELAEGSCIAAG